MSGFSPGIFSRERAVAQSSNPAVRRASPVARHDQGMEVRRSAEAPSSLFSSGARTREGSVGLHDTRLYGARRAHRTVVGHGSRNARLLVHPSPRAGTRSDARALRGCQSSCAPRRVLGAVPHEAFVRRPSTSKATHADASRSTSTAPPTPATTNSSAFAATLPAPKRPSQPSRKPSTATPCAHEPPHCCAPSAAR
jgi:hypothetical protein